MTLQRLARLRHRHRHRAGSSATVNIHIREFSQLFNSLDPSPFWDRDLDRQAAEFIEEEFSEKPAADTWNLCIHTHDGGASAPDLQTALENYYGRMASSARRALREHFWSGQWTLVAGVVVFLLAMALRSMLGGLLGRLPQILDEGLIILAWLALWRPAEMLLYGWVPLRRREKLYERLARIRVSVRADTQVRPLDAKTAALGEGRTLARDQPPQSD